MNRTCPGHQARHVVLDEAGGEPSTRLELLDQGIGQLLDLAIDENEIERGVRGCPLFQRPGFDGDALDPPKLFDKRWVFDSRERVRRELGIPAGARVSLVATTFHGHGQPTATVGASHINWATVAGLTFSASAKAD